MPYSFYSTTDTLIVNLLHFSDISRSLRWTFSNKFFVSKTKLNIGKRAFSVALPIWNQHPIAIKASETIHTFRKKLKTYLFEIAFPPYISSGSVLQ